MLMFYFRRPWSIYLDWPDSPSRLPLRSATTVWQCLWSSWQPSPTNRAFPVVAPRSWNDLAARRRDICRVVVHLPPASQGSSLHQIIFWTVL